MLGKRNVGFGCMGRNDNGDVIWVVLSELGCFYGGFGSDNVWFDGGKEVRFFKYGNRRRCV